MTHNHRLAPIGVFDSGVGGLSVLRAIWKELPYETAIYLADQAHVPYGSRPLEEVRAFAEEITRFLLAQGAKLIVVACNAASAAALQHLRSTFEGIPFVGMEPAVKPAAEQTQSGVVGVLATPATFQGALYASVVERFTAGVRLLQDTCPGLVAEIENGDIKGMRTRSILENALAPMLVEGIDTVVLGCTHYPFVIPIIQEIVGPGVRVIDPAPAVARQVRRLLTEHSQLVEIMPGQTGRLAQFTPSGPTHTRFLTSGKASQFQQLISQLLSIDAQVDPVYWEAGNLSTGKSAF